MHVNPFFESLAADKRGYCQGAVGAPTISLLPGEGNLPPDPHLPGGYASRIPIPATPPNPNPGSPIDSAFPIWGW
jgi:hypothetical protein